MKALIIGYGSIGKRHEEVLLDIAEVQNVDLVTKQNIANKKTFSSLDQAPLSDYDYFVIASETFKHYKQLSYINEQVTNKIIFCEKPLFDKNQPFTGIDKNHIYIGYVLRFHPLMQKLKDLLKQDSVYYASIESGSYLPNWRVDSDYRQSYSASTEKGGGVLLDLSHELDYLSWLFGDVLQVQSKQVKISELEIDSDDLTTFIAHTDKNIVTTVIMNYFSKIPVRRIMVHGAKYTYELDMIKGCLNMVDTNNQHTNYLANELQRNDLYTNMHKDALKNGGVSTTLQEGLDTMKLISIIQEQNK